MSRIGKKPIPVLDGVKVAVSGRNVTSKAPRESSSGSTASEVAVNSTRRQSRSSSSASNDERESRAFHGLTRALINNMIFGVKNGYEKKLEIVGVGYLAALKGKMLSTARRPRQRAAAARFPSA